MGGGEKIAAIGLWQWHCPNRRKKKKWQLICGNGIAEIEEREREMFEYKKKYTYSYFLVLFLPKQFGMCVCHVLSFRIVKVPYETNKDRFKYNEYTDSYSKKST